MLDLVRCLVTTLFASRAKLAAENLALRHQLGVLGRSVKRPRIRKQDRIFWVWLSKLWPDWRAALVVVNHVGDLVSIDFVTVPTVTFRVLFVFVVLAHERRRVIHFNVTDSPNAKWTAQQIVEAFPWDTAPRYLLRDRDGIYGHEFASRIDHMGITEVKTAPRSPWQNPFVERLIGTLRRDCLDHIVVFNENHLRRILRDYLVYYHSCRTHLSLEKDSPEPRKVESPGHGTIVEFPIVGGLHHRYRRLAA